MRVALFGCALLAVSIGSLGAADKMTMDVSPEVSFAPGRIVVRATIEKDAANRAVQIVAESPDYYRSSTIHLEGEQAVRTTEVQFGGLPRGNYNVSARLLGQGDEVLAWIDRAVIVTAPQDAIPR
jgi:hypothetical protein